MKLSTRVLTANLTIAFVFVVLILGIMLQYSNSVKLTNQYIGETEPARETIEHLMNNIFSDFLLTEKYLLETDYSTLLEYDKSLQILEEECEKLTDEVDDLIVLGEISNEAAIESYNVAILIYSSWQRSRNSLLEMHREVVATGKRNYEIDTERQRFIELMQESTKNLAASLQNINDQNAQLQNELIKQTTTTRTLLIILLTLFILVSGLTSYYLTTKLTGPLTQMSTSSKQFTRGNYKTRIDENSDINEISSLQKQMNRVYTLIEKTSKSSKKKVQNQLLPTQYKEILDFIKASNSDGKAPTIKDVKKKFSLTHPTAISRLKYLQENNYIIMKKQGRDKLIFET